MDVSLSSPFLTTNQTMCRIVPRFSEGDVVEFTLQEGASGMDAMVVMNGVSDVYVRARSAALFFAAHMHACAVQRVDVSQPQELVEGRNDLVAVPVYHPVFFRTIYAREDSFFSTVNTGRNRQVYYKVCRGLGWQAEYKAC